MNQRKAHGVGNLGIVVAALPQRNQCFGRAAVILMEKTAQAEQRAYILTLRLACQGGLQRCDSIGVILALELGKPKVELQVWQPRVPGCGLRQQLSRSLEVCLARSQEPKLAVSFCRYFSKKFRGFF